MLTLPPTPEPHTLALACALASLFLAAVMGSIRNPWVETRGTRWFSTAALAAALSFLLVTFAPGNDNLAVTALRAANTVLVFGLLVGGLCRFVGQPVPWLLLALSLLVMALAVVLYPDSHEDVAPRVAVFSLLVISWSLGGVWLLWRHPVPALPRRGPLVTVLGLLLLALCAALRALWLLSHGRVSGEQALNNPVNAWLLLAGFAALLLTLTGLALMLNARMVQELVRWNSHDALTGCFNRRGFNAHCPAWLRAHGPGHVVLIDLECANANVPEAALMALVHSISSLQPAQGLLARQGGGSFLSALPQSLDSVQVDAWCEQLEQELTARLALLWGAGRATVTVAIGQAPVLHGSLADAARRANLSMRGAHPHLTR